MNCAPAAAEEEEGDEEEDEGPGGVAGYETVGDAVPGDTQAMVAGGGAGNTGGSLGRVRASAAIVLAAGSAAGSAEEPTRVPHLSQNFDSAAICAPHSSQNRTDSTAMTGSRAAQAQAPPNRWIKRCSNAWALSSASFAPAGSV